MHLLDILILAVIAVGCLRGYMTGLFRQIGATVGFLLAFFFAAGLMTGVGARLTDLLGVEGDVGPILGFIVVFVVVFVIVLLLVRFAESALVGTQLSSLNHAGGAVVGGLFGALVMSALLVVLSYVNMPSHATRNSSHLYGPTAGLAPVVWSYMSSNREVFASLTNRLDLEGLNDWVGPGHRAPKPPPPRRYDRPQSQG